MTASSLMLFLVALCGAVFSTNHVVTAFALNHAFGVFLRPASLSRRAASQVSQDPPGLSSLQENDTSVSKDYDTLLETVQTRKVDPDIVFESMLRLEKQSYRDRWTQSQETADRMTQELEGNWRPVFSSGTTITQARLGGKRLNYFPIKAVISLKPDEGKIQNGLYVGDYYLIRLNGTCEYQPKLRRFRFGFDHISLLNGMFHIDLSAGQDIQFAVAAGLGGKIGLWNILLADGRLLMARGAGQAITLWRRELNHHAEWW